MSSSGLNWCPIIDAWLKKRESKMSAVLRVHVETSFFKVYDWARQNVRFKMPMLEANVVFQVKCLCIWLKKSFQHGHGHHRFPIRIWSFYFN
jgi:dynein heavy chain